MAAAAQHCLALGPSLSQPPTTACSIRKPRLAVGAFASRKSNGNGLDEDRVQLESLLTQDMGAQLQLQACSRCGSKGHVQCPTCVGSGLYIDSILESQGIIVQVECLGCGGCGNVMCPQCGGRGQS